MSTSINNVANEVYKVLSSIYKVETFNSDGNRVYDYDDARNFYCKPGKIIVSIIENGERHIIDVKLNKNVDIKDFENSIGQKLRKIATRNTNVSYNIRSYGREIKPKEENTMSTENVQEGMYGTTRSSYQKVGECKVIIRHSGRVNEDKHGARSRHISAIFVETKNGERFKIAENNLHGARAMARHLSNGGSPFDTVGMKVTTMMSEMNELKGMILEARTISKGAITEHSTSLIEQMRAKFLSIRESLKRMGGKVGYSRTASSLTEGALNGNRLSTYIYNDITDTEYDVEVEYELTSESPQTRMEPAESGEIQIIAAIDVSTGKDMREFLTTDDEERIEGEIIDHESSEYEARADYEYDLIKDDMQEEIVNEYKTAGGMQDLSTPWEDRDAWADAVLAFINRKIKLSTARKPEYQHNQASALALLKMSDEARDEFFSILASRKTNEGITEEAKLDTTKKVAGDQSVEISDVKIEDDAGEQVQDMADFARDKQSDGNYADVDDLLSADEVKESAILEAWFDEAANIHFFNEEELIVEEEPAPVVEKTLPNTALHQLNLHMGNPLFNDLIAMYEGQGILDQVTELVEDDSTLKDEMNKSRNRLREFHEMDEIGEAFKLLNELVSKNKMGSEDAIDIAAKKYANEYHDGDKMAYEQASEALRQMATEEGMMHADAGRTFTDDVMSHSDEIRKHKDEIEAEEFYGDAHFEDMEEGSEDITETPKDPIVVLDDTPQDHGDEHAYGELSHSVKEMMNMGMSKEAAFAEAANNYEEDQLSSSHVTGYEPKGYFKEYALELLFNGDERGEFDNVDESISVDDNAIEKDNTYGATEIQKDSARRRKIHQSRENDLDGDDFYEAENNHVFASAKDIGDDNKDQLDKDVSGPYVGEGYYEMPPMDRERYQERTGLEGPFMARNGKVYYYDPIEGKNYDPDSDFYISDEDFMAMSAPTQKTSMDESDNTIEKGPVDKARAMRRHHRARKVASAKKTQRNTNDEGDVTDFAVRNADNMAYKSYDNKTGQTFKNRKADIANTIEDTLENNSQLTRMQELAGINNQKSNVQEYNKNDDVNDEWGSTKDYNSKYSKKQKHRENRQKKEYKRTGHIDDQDIFNGRVIELAKYKI